MPLQPNFDRVARLYRWAEYLALGPLLTRTRNHFLVQLAPACRALILGDGDGRFTARLLSSNPAIHVLAVDTSSAMLHLLRNRCLRTSPNAADRFRTLQASALEITPSPATDLIVTHFFLDCLIQPEVDALTEHIAAYVAPGTLWLLSDFSQPRPRILRPLAALYIRALYLAFRVLTGLRATRLPDPQVALTRAGFQRVARHERLFGLLYTELWRRTSARPVESNCGLQQTANRPSSRHPIAMNTTQQPASASHGQSDPLPDPEPAAPSLPAPDSGVFHHEPATPRPQSPDPQTRAEPTRAKPE